MPELNDSFGRVCYLQERITAEAVRQREGSDLDSALESVRAYRATRQVLMGDVTRSLAQKIGEGDDTELLDLFSGDAIAPWALLMAGRINRFTLVDKDFAGGWFDYFHIEMAKRLGVSGQKFLSLMLDVPGLQVPQIRLTTMINTGLALPDDDRNTWDQQVRAFQYYQQVGCDVQVLRRKYSDAFVRGHIDSPNLSQVLTLLGDTRRRVLFAEQGKKYKPAGDAARGHLQGVVDDFGGEWTVGSVDDVGNDGIVIAEILHN